MVPHQVDRVALPTRVVDVCWPDTPARGARDAARSTSPHVPSTARRHVPSNALQAAAASRGRTFWPENSR